MGHSILDAIGNTPLVEIKRLNPNSNVKILAKLEYFNPGGSVKDRIGAEIIEDAERRGELEPGGVIVEATSGNTGVALAIAAALKGYRCIFTLPDKMSQEKVRLLRAFGAEVIITPTAVPPDHPENYLMKAKAIVKETPRAVFANQFYNQANVAAHYRTTGPELWEQSEGKISHLVGSAGTGGTLSGAAQFLKEKNPAIRVIAGDPEGSIYAEYSRTQTVGEGHTYKVEGIGGDKIPETLHYDLIDEFHTLSDRESFQMARRLARDEGLFVGGSAGMNVALAVKTAKEIDDPDAFIVAILCDTGERYLSKLYNDEWMRENQMMEIEHVTAEDLLSGKPARAPILVTVEPSHTVRQALNLMSTYSVSQLPVIDAGDCVGSLSEGPLMTRAVAVPAVLDQRVQDLMEEPFPIVAADFPLEGFSELLSRESPAVLVRRGDTLTGIVTRYDVLHHVAGIS